MQDFLKLQNECISGQVSPPSQVRLDAEFGLIWDTFDGAATITLSLSLLQELSRSQLQWLLEWICYAKSLESRLDLTLLPGPLLLQRLRNQEILLNLMANIILSVPLPSNPQSLGI
jgi:hypothetical protein